MFELQSRVLVPVCWFPCVCVCVCVCVVYVALLYLRCAFAAAAGPVLRCVELRFPPWPSAARASLRGTAKVAASAPTPVFLCASDELLGSEGSTTVRRSPRTRQSCGGMVLMWLLPPPRSPTGAAGHVERRLIRRAALCAWGRECHRQVPNHVLTRFRKVLDSNGQPQPAAGGCSGGGGGGRPPLAPPSATLPHP